MASPGDARLPRNGLGPLGGQPGKRGLELMIACYQRGLVTRVAMDTFELSPPLIARAHRCGIPFAWSVRRSAPDLATLNVARRWIGRALLLAGIAPTLHAECRQGA